MGLYSYKKYVRTPKTVVVEIASQLSLIAGILVLFWALFPLVSYQLVHIIDKQFSPAAPVNDKSFETVKNPSVLGAFNIFSTNLRDFTNAQLWFPEANAQEPAYASTKLAEVKEYTLTIPKLNIFDAKVVVGGEDLSKSLLHYRPVSLPGEIGNVAIFGHSTLPQLYNVKDYKSIFTYLPSLEKNDEIFVNLQGVEYKYTVEEMFVVKPEEVSVLDPLTDGSYLTLITCVPPGTYWNRLVVRAKLNALPASP